MVMVDGTSRQRVAVSSGMSPDDDLVDTQVMILAESSVSTDAEQDKYDKSSRRRKKLRRSKKGKNGPRPIEILGVLGVFAAVLLIWHYNVKVRQDRRRHAKALYDRAETILKHLDKKGIHHGQHGPHRPGPPRTHRRHPVVSQDDDQKDDQAAPNNVVIPQRYAGGAIPSTEEVEGMFEHHRLIPNSAFQIIPGILNDWIKRWDMDVQQNVRGGIRWIRPYLLPGMDDLPHHGRHGAENSHAPSRAIMNADRAHARLKWQEEFDQLVARYGGAENIPGPPVDYTDPDKYEYPPLMEEPPVEGGYPRMISLGDMMKAWDQDDDNDGKITETLLHFDFSNPRELAMAQKFRDAMLPFKLYNVPELSRATKLWTDEYVSKGFEEGAHGTCQESVNHYFAFFTAPQWTESRMGMPPTRNNDYSFAHWAAHARYADATKLPSDAPHFYWQSGVDKGERYAPKSEWTFISRDLPSWSATEPNFIMFNPEDQKGIQCRFGERGVVAATHYDSGRNMVGMITGAKRYILSPPNACGKLGIFSNKGSPIYRHSLLNFGHIKYLDDPELSEGMSDEERLWLERAATAPAVETVLKAGEVLYIPSFWFHYIISVQKSAQCNARSGVEIEQHPEFGGAEDAKECAVE